MEPKDGAPPFPSRVPLARLPRPFGRRDTVVPCPWCILQFRDHAPGEPTGRTTMNDSYPSRKSTDKPQEKRSLLERLTDFISPEPE